MKQPNFEVSATQLVEIIDNWVIGSHAERNRAIIKRRLIDGICYEPLAEEFDLSVKQVKNICSKCMQTIIKHI